LLAVYYVIAIDQSQEEAKQQNQESKETRDQIEEDVDREVLLMRIRHEHTVREQQVNGHQYGRILILPYSRVEFHIPLDFGGDSMAQWIASWLAA